MSLSVFWYACVNTFLLVPFTFSIFKMAMAMAMPIRATRVSDPLDDERIKIRFGHRSLSITSSGSEHDGEVDTTTATLSENLIYGYFGDEESTSSSNNICDDESNPNDNCSACAAHVIQTLQHLLNPYKKPDCQFLLRLCTDVARAAHSLLDLGKPSVSSYHRRAVMTWLRNIGYNAGICKSRWDASGGLIAGCYEYIDVLVPNENEGVNTRYMVDLEFRAEFEVARGTEEYQELVKELPRVMVGRGEELRGVVKLMADAARRSLKGRGLSVPPWRKNRYMIAKWFGPYRRTVNPLHPPSATTVVGRMEVKCRTVGFMATPPAIGTVQFR